MIKFKFAKKRYKNDFEYNSLKVLFGVWILAFLLLNYAFAGHTSTLAVEGAATIQKHIYDYVYITHVDIGTSSGGSSNNFSFLDHEIRADVSLPSCNNYVTYRASIVNGTPYKAYITNAGLKSAYNGNGVATNSFSVEFYDTNGNPIVLNDTFIPRYSSMPVDVKIKNNCTGSDTSGVVTADFEYSLYKYFDLTINSVTPSDGVITLTTPEGNFTGTGSVTHRVMEGETATYHVEKKYYYPANGSYTMMADDHTENITLIPDPHRDLTINASPSSSTIVVKQDNQVICSGSGSLVCSVESGKNVTYTVDEPEYYYSESGGTYYGYSETFLMPATETTKSVSLTERPWITGSLPNTNRGTARTLTNTNWHPGYYLVELWGGDGAQGDQQQTSGGTAGYIYGVVYIAYNNSTYWTSGGNGARGADETGGANGGGNAGTDNASTPASAGGYSAFAVGASSITEAGVNNGNVKFIVGGGGGSSGRGGMAGTFGGGSGGNGGGMSAVSSSITAGKVLHGGDGGTGYNRGQGYGGTTSGGGTNSGGDNGAFLTGGNARARGGGGGGGYFGGGGGGGYRTPLSGANYGPGGGGGGSSFIAKDVTYSGLPSSVTNKLTSSNPSSTGGCVKVQWIGKTM